MINTEVLDDLLFPSQQTKEADAAELQLLITFTDLTYTQSTAHSYPCLQLEDFVSCSRSWRDRDQGGGMWLRSGGRDGPGLITLAR